MNSGWETLRKVVPEADNLGYWGFVMPDHYMWGPEWEETRLLTHGLC